MSIANEISRIQSAKADIKTAIEAKGVTVPSSATIDTYPTYVSQIPAGGGDDSTLRDLIEGDITSITIPSGTTSIKEYGFVSCSSLSSVTIPDSVTSIGNYAFSACRGLTSVTIPDSVTSIGDGAFGSSSLTSVTIPDSVTSIGMNAFSFCSGLTSVSIGSGATSIGYGTFRNCSGLTSVTIPDSVTSIGEQSFGNCYSLTSVTIPDSVTSIGNNAFYQCAGLTSVHIGSGVTSIGNNVFQYCSSLTSIEIPDSVTSIGNYAFSACRGLTSITIPDSVTSIGQTVFENCSGLTSVTIGSGTTSIGNNAFRYCTGLDSFTVKATTPPTLGGSNVFYRASSNFIIYVPSASVETYKAAQYWSTYASRIQAIPSPQPPVQCETPESTETYPLDDDFDTTKAIWSLMPDNVTDFDEDGNEDYYYFENAYVVLSEDGQTPDYTIVADMIEGGTSEVDICEYDANGENFAGTVLTALTEDLYIGMCDYFQKPMYVMDFSQYEISQWQSYTAGDTVPSGAVNGIRLYQNVNQGDGVTFSGQSGTIAFEFDGMDWTATDGNYDPVDISGYYDGNDGTYTILFSDLGYDGMEITTPSPELEETFSFDLDLYAVTQKVNEFEADVETEE